MATARGTAAKQQAPFIVEQAEPLDELRRGAPLDWPSGGMRVTRPPPKQPARPRHSAPRTPAPRPLLVEWADGNGGSTAGGDGGVQVLLRSRSMKVDAAEDLVAALRDLLGSDAVVFRKAS